MAEEVALEPRIVATSIEQLPVANTVAVVSGVEHLEPEAVQDLLRRRQCLLVDLRGDDRAAGLIEGAIHEPWQSFFNRVSQLAQSWANEPLIVFTCQYSTQRAPHSANWYRSAADSRQRVAVLAGGFGAWESRGLPVKQFAPEITPQTAELVQEFSPSPEATNSISGTRGGHIGADLSSPSPQHILLAPTAVKVTPPTHMRSLNLATGDLSACTDLQQPEDFQHLQDNNRQRHCLAAAS